MPSIERRAYLRYNLSIPVDLIDQDGAMFEVLTRNISLGAMCVACQSGMLIRLLPNGARTASSDEMILKTVFRNHKLNNIGTDEEIVLQSQVLGVMRFTESNFSIRFAFVDIDQRQQDQLQRLLNT